MYERVITSSAKRSLKKLPRQVRQHLLESTIVFETKPFAGEQLSGSLNFLYSFHFKSKNIGYRLVYTLNHEKKQVVIHFANTRENFYEKLRRLFG